MVTCLIVLSLGRILIGRANLFFALVKKTLGSWTTFFFLEFYFHVLEFYFIINDLTFTVIALWFTPSQAGCIVPACC